MPDSTPPPPDPQQPLVRAGVDLLRHTLDQTPLHPHVFDEVAVAASALHKACSALDPVLNLPRPGPTALAASPSSEGAGASAMRQLVSAIQQMAGGGGGAKSSMKDLMAAIVVAERAGMKEDAEILRAELHGSEVDVEDDLLPPKAKVDRAKELLEKASDLNNRAKRLMRSVPADRIIEDVSAPPLEPPLGRPL